MAERAQSWRTWLQLVSVAALYFAAAKLGLALSVAYGNVTPVWPPTGIALAAVLLFGYRIWPAVMLGAFVANATTDIPIWTAGVIAFGNTSESLVGAFLLKRLNLDVGLGHVKDVMKLVLVGAVVATTIAATVGTTALVLAAEIPSERFAYAWKLWWFGDGMGALLVAPLLLAWGVGKRPPVERRASRYEALLLGAVLAGTSWLVFFGGRWSYPHLLFPLLVWAALRFGQRGATASMLLCSAVAIAGTLNGSAPIGGATQVEGVQILQILMGLVAVTIFVLAATIAERDEAERLLDAERMRVQEMKMRHDHALELNDTVVQGLAVARMSLELGLDDQVEESLRRTLDAARSIVSDLLQDLEAAGDLKPGALVRGKSKGSRAEPV